jgi:RNA polymerase sigma factor (sigma-70 family)
MNRFLLTAEEELNHIKEIKSLILIDNYLSIKTNIFYLSIKEINQSILIYNRLDILIKQVSLYKEILRMGILEIRKKEKYKVELIEKNKRLIASIAKRYLFKSELGIEDLIQEGVIGLIQAIKKFDINKGTRLSTYATPWIKQSIRYSIDKHKNIKIPVHIKKLNSQINAILIHLRKELNREPLLQEIIKEGKKRGIILSRDKLYEIQSLPRDENIISLNTPRNNTEHENIFLLDIIKVPHPEDDLYNPENYMEKVNKRECIDKLIDKLPEENMKQVIKLFYGLDETNKNKSYRVISKTLNIGIEEVRRLYNRAIVILKTSLYISVIDFV